MKPTSSGPARLGSLRRVIALASGKGGVGTSVLTTNLGAFLAQIGKGVVIVDLNLSNAMLHSWLGMKRPSRTLGDLIDGRYQSLSEVVVETPVTGLYLVAGPKKFWGTAGWAPDVYRSIFEQIQNLETDFVLLDLPSGVGGMTLELFSAADVPIAVTCATPDAVEATYNLLCASYLHSLLQNDIIDTINYDTLAHLEVDGDKPLSPREIWKKLDEIDMSFAETARETASVFHPQFIVNQTRIKADEELGQALVSASLRWLGLNTTLLGSVGWDDNVWLSARKGLPLLTNYSPSRACKDLERIIRRLLGQEFKDLFDPTPYPAATDEQNLYELLEIYLGASEEEVRRALKQIKAWYSADGLAYCGSCSEQQQQDYIEMTAEAHATLLDKSKRRAYDRANFPDGFTISRNVVRVERESIAGPVAATHDSLPEVVLSDSQKVDGAFLGRIRRERNVELRDISNRTKISKTYLKALEEEQYEQLPAAVFTRGFVTEFARFLKIDPDRAVKDFMEKYDIFRQKKGMVNK